MKILMLLLLVFINFCKSAVIQSQTSERRDDFYSFSYTLDDGTARYEEGTLKSENDVKFFKVNGYYKYTGTDGKIYIVDYFTDQSHGYRARLSVLDELPSVIGITPHIDLTLIKSLVG